MTQAPRARKLRLQCRELLDGDVEYISLVGRGANRTPFKKLASEAGITPEDGTVIRFENVFKSAPKPTLGAVLVAKSSDRVETLKAHVAAAGYAVNQPNETDECITYVQATQPPNSTPVVFKIDEDLAVLTYVEKGFALDPGTLGLAVEDKVFPGIGDALGALREAIGAALGSEDAVAKIEEAIASFAKYAKGIVAGAPVEAFKLDVAPQEFTKQVTQKAENILTLVKASAKKTDDPPKEDAKADDSPKDDVKQESPVQKADASANEAVLAAIAGLTDTVKGIARKVDQSAARIGAVERGLTEAKVAAKKAEDAAKRVGSTVFNTAFDDDVRKGDDGDDDPSIPFRDSAWGRLATEPRA